MLRPLYRYKTRCCPPVNESEWQYSLASRIFPCQKCKLVGQGFAALPVEVPMPVASAHSPCNPYSCIRVAFITANGGFLNYQLGDDMHCGLVSSHGVVTSFVPNVGVRKEVQSWDQAIIVIPSDSSTVTAHQWDANIAKGRDNIRTNIFTDKLDCLDFAVMMLNNVFKKDRFNREKLSELMCRQLYYVLNYAELQRTALPK